MSPKYRWSKWAIISSQNEIQAIFKNVGFWIENFETNHFSWRDLRRAKLSCSYCLVLKLSNFDFGAAISFFVNKCILGNVSVFLTLFWPENTILAAFFTIWTMLHTVFRVYMLFTGKITRGIEKLDRELTDEIFYFQV